MANGLFNIYDARANERDDLEKSAMQFANLSPGRGMVAASTQAGGMFGQGARNLLGGMSPEAAKAYKIKEIMSKYADSDKNDPNIYRKMITEFTSAGLLKEAEEAASILKQMDALSGGSSMSKNIRDIAKNQLQCSFNEGDANYDPKCYEKASEIYKNIKRAGPGEKFAGYQAKSFNELGDDIYEQEVNARNNVASIDQSLNAMESFYTGPGGDLVDSLRAVGTIFGLNIESEAEAENFISKSTSRVLDYVNQTKGSISDKEMEIFAKATTSLSRTKAGNELILHTMKATNEYLLRKAAEFDRWTAQMEDLGEQPTKGKWSRHLRKWEQEGENRLVLPTAKQIEDAKNDVRVNFTANYGSGQGATTGSKSGTTQSGIKWKIVE